MAPAASEVRLKPVTLSVAEKTLTYLDPPHICEESPTQGMLQFVSATGLDEGKVLAQ